jgi:hypothetical protein
VGAEMQVEDLERCQTVVSPKKYGTTTWFSELKRLEHLQVDAPFWPGAGAMAPTRGHHRHQTQEEGPEGAITGMVWTTVMGKSHGPYGFPVKICSFFFNQSLVIHVCHVVISPLLPIFCDFTDIFMSFLEQQRYTVFGAATNGTCC